MKTINYFYNLQDKIEDSGRKIIIIDREIRTTKLETKIMNRKWYKYRCCKCNNEDWISEYNLKNSKNDRRLPNRKNQKPVYCETFDIYFDCARTASKHFNLNDAMIKKSANKSILYSGMKFNYITQQEFNDIKMQSPTKVVGDFFIYKGDTDG